MSNVDSRQFDPQRHGPELSAYVDNELSGPERAEVERLLAESPAARAAMAELREVADALRSLPREPSPIDFAASVRREGLANVGSSGSPPERVWRIPFGLRTLASAAVLAICVGTTWRIMLPPARPTADVALGERMGREIDRGVDSRSRLRSGAVEAPEWPVPEAPVPGPSEPLIATGRAPVDSTFAARRHAGVAGRAGDRRDDLHDGVVSWNEGAAGLAGATAGTVQFDDAGNRLTNFGRVYIPTQTTEQYNAVRFTISAIERSVGQAPSYLTPNDVPTVEQVQLRVPVERAPEVLSLLNDMVLPEQVRVELNVANDESSYRQLQMLLSQAMSQPDAQYAFAASQPDATLGAALELGGKSASDGELERPTDKSAAVAAAAPQTAAPRRESAEIGSKSLGKMEQGQSPAVAESATRKESGEADTLDHDASREARSKEGRGAARRPGAVDEMKSRGGGAGAGDGRGYPGGGEAERPQFAPAGGVDRVDADARMQQQPRSERVTALITRGQEVWSQLSNSASTIVNRFGEVTQSNRRQSNATGDLLMFEVMILPPPQATQPAWGQEGTAGEQPAGERPR